MSPNANRDRPHVFMLRLWAEKPAAAATEWRGKVQSLPDGEAYYFRSWEGLLAHLQMMVAAGEIESTGSETKGETHEHNSHLQGLA